MCCGQKRSELKAEGSPDPNAVKLMYRGPSSTQIRGFVTGQVYHFSRPNIALAVDPRDAVLMVRTRLFRQVQ